MNLTLWCGLLAGVLCLAGCKKAEGPATAPAAAGTNAVVTGLPKGLAEKLQGKWARTDGDYLLQIKSVEASSGKMEAGYFNPQPIHVSKAEAKMDGNTLKVFVELRDTGYPGCTYTLAYNTATDQLFGVYFQAAMQQQYEVMFERAQ